MSEKELMLNNLHELRTMLINHEKDFNFASKLQQEIEQINEDVNNNLENEVSIPAFIEHEYILNKKTLLFYRTLYVLLTGLLVSILFHYLFFEPFDLWTLFINFIAFSIPIFLSVICHNVYSNYPTSKLGVIDLILGIIILIFVCFILYSAFNTSKTHFLIMYPIICIILWYITYRNINYYEDKWIFNNEEEINEAKERSASVLRRNEALIDNATTRTTQISHTLDKLIVNINESSSNILNFTNGWYPEDFLTSNMVSLFIDYLKSGRADNLKEAINCYHEDVFRAKQLKASSEMLNAINDQVQLQSFQNELLQRNNELQNNTNDLIEKNNELHSSTNSLLEKNNQLQHSNNILLQNNLKAQQKTQKTIEKANIEQAKNNSLLERNNSLLEASKKSIDYNNALSKDISRKLK